MTKGVERMAHCAQYPFRNDCSRSRRPRCATQHKEITMQWTTPTATDFRFGFEITMYVAAR